MDIKVIGSCCDKCDKLYENTKLALEELGLNIEIEKVADLMKIVQLGVMTAPSLLIDGKLVVSGQVASKEKIIQIINKQINK